MAKYLKFITTIYNDTITDEKELRSVFDIDEIYKVIFENDDFYILEFPDYSYQNYKDNPQQLFAYVSYSLFNGFILV